MFRRKESVCAAHDIETESKAQPPPDTHQDHEIETGKNRSARIAVPETYDADLREVAEGLHPGLDLSDEFERFRDFNAGERPRKRHGWLGLWKNWLKTDVMQDRLAKGEIPTAGNASANGHANGTNGHNPPRKHRGCGQLDKFLSSGLELCNQCRHEAVGSSGLLGDEERRLRRQLVQIFHGEDQILGVKWGPNLSPDEVFARLPEFDRFAQHDPSGLPEGSLAK